MNVGTGRRGSSRRTVGRRLMVLRPMREIRAPRGFTLIEMVLVMVVAAVLAVFVAPRLVGINDFSARGFQDETLALLRYAQKSAVAQRRPVCVSFIATGASLSIDADRNPATGTLGCEADLTGARGERPAAVLSRGPVQYTSVPAPVVFDGLGRPSAGATIRVVGAAGQVTVEAVTGYVHD